MTGILRLATAAFASLLWVLFLHPIFRRKRQDAHWVIGGHRGRLYADNAAAVERAARKSGQPVVWIANRELLAELRAQGVAVLERNTWAARKAISRAPALIYSHGEDDLDLLLILLRGRTGHRFYLNHSLNLLKAGGVLDPTFSRLSRPLQAIKRWLITDCDTFLCATNAERESIEKSYPMHAPHLGLGGGAHLDAWLTPAPAPKKRIYWFPTFRESPKARRRLEEVAARLCSNTRLRDWLLANDYEFFLGSHVNTQASRLLAAPPFFVASPAQLGSDLRESALLISDYSGVVFNFLLLGRPLILFAFDLDDYLKRRVFYDDYSAFDFALQPRSTDDLVEALVSGAWGSETLRARADAAREHYFPRALLEETAAAAQQSGPGFAQATVRAIVTQLGD